MPGHPKLGEREVVAAMLDHERARLRPGLLILDDKGFAGRDFAQAVAEHVPDCCVPIAPTSPAGWGR